MSDAPMAANPTVASLPVPTPQEVDEMRARKRDMNLIDWRIFLATQGAASRSMIERYTFRTPTKTALNRKNKMAKIYKRAYYANKKKSYGRRSYGRTSYKKKSYKKKYYKKRY